MNVAPPKPTRLLTEMERKALLTHDLSPGTPASQDSQKIPPLFESATSTLDNQQDLYNVHWDMLNEDILLSLEKENLFPELYELPRLELDLDTSWISAPLASPENLSVSSSAMSLENALKNKCVSSTSVKLETIQQSPDVAVKIDTASKSSLDNDSGSKSGAVIVDINTPSDAANVTDGAIVKDVSQSKMDDNLSAINVNGSPKLIEVHEQNTNPNQETDSHFVQMDNDLHTNHQSPQFHSSPLNHTENTLKAAECDTPLLDKHSPIESSQNVQLHPLNHVSPINTQKSPEGLGRRKPSPRRTLSPKVPSPANKRLHYSQSESYIETLSDKYQMKRSKEQGDIAHLRDSAKVFEANSSKSQEKLLKPRESEPLFEESKLPQVHSAILESSFKEIEDNSGVLMAVAEVESDGPDDSYLEIQKDINRETDCLLPQMELPESVEAEFREFNESILNQTEPSESAVTLTANSESNDSKLTLVENASSSENLPLGEEDILCVRENENFVSENENIATSESDKLLATGHDVSSALESDNLPAVEVYEPLVTSIDSFLEDESMEDMYSKTTRLSVSEGTYSGSEKRSSSSGQSTSGHSISGHSDEYPMIETDV